MTASNVEDIYELSAMQGGLFFHTIVADEPSLYFEQTCFELTGSLDPSTLAAAWQLLVDRHAVLRTSFHWQETHKPVQVVHTSAKMRFAFIDWTGVDGDLDSRVEELLCADRNRPFDLEQPPLLRVAVVRVSELRHLLVVSFHHLLLDGWSAQVLYAELQDMYRAVQEGRAPTLGRARPYAEFIAWQQRQDAAAAERFWRRELAGVGSPTPVPLASTRPSAGTWQSETRRLPATLTDALTTRLRRDRLTLNTAIHGAYAVVLSRFTGQSDVVFGSVVSGRPAELPDVEAMVGLFINTVPIRANVGRRELGPWLAEMQDCQTRRAQYEWAPLVDIQSWSAIEPPSPLFHSVVAFENYPTMAGRVEAAEAREARYFTRTNYPLNLAVASTPAISLTFLWDDGIVDRPSIVRLFDGMTKVLGAIADGTALTLDELSVVPPTEHARLRAWSAPTTPFEPTTVHEMFEEQVDRAPEAIALLTDGKELTYAELDRRANALARRLRAAGVRRGARVGVYLDRSCELIVAVLAVLKAGAAFLPLDPTYPRQRLADMIADAELALLICGEGDSCPIPPGLAVVAVSDASPLDDAAGRVELGGEKGDPSDLAYLIYTSGSTGRPKAVEIGHAGLANVIAEQRRMCRLTGGDRVLQFSTPSFDAFVYELLMAFGAGAALCVGNRSEIDPGPALAGFIGRLGVTAMLLPPSGLRALPLEGCATVHTVAVAGEACPADLVERWAPGRRFLNLYGPTEATIWTTVAECTGGLDPPSIGRPIANARVYVLDGERRLVPLGVAGELYIGGVGVARGYWGQPELTAQRFVEDPFVPGERLYRSGDLVRWRADGELEFLGRLDEQVKLRGFRIEPGEVEAALRSHSGVADAVVVVREDVPGDRRLVGYVVSGEEPSPTAESLRELLAGTLPEFMVPNILVTLPAIPLLPNGKVDRLALPKPDSTRPLTDPSYVAPVTTTERAVVTIWAEVLGVDRVGIDDGFFDLGGHSLLATQVVSRSREAFDVDIPIGLLFESRTPRTFSAAIDVLTWAGAGVAPEESDDEVYEDGLV